MTRAPVAVKMFRDVVQRASAKANENDEFSADDEGAKTMPMRGGAVSTSARAEDVRREMREQRESRRKTQPHGRINEEDMKRGVLESRASFFDDSNSGESKAMKSWKKALGSVRHARQTNAIADVSALEWADVDGLFAYYDAVYFENKLAGRVTFSWNSSPGASVDGKEATINAFDSMFKYCLCSEIPKWWHGANPRQLCVGICCVVERRASTYTRAAHLRMPDVLRRFKMTQMAKEALLHGMTHAYLFVIGHTAENAAFNAHDDEFKRITYKLNHDFVTVDAFRPPDKGYSIRWFDRSIAESKDDVETEKLKGQLFKSSMVDTLTTEHYKLLYLISKHSRLAEKVTQKERWVRYIHLMVLVYEAVIHGVFDYDYAPCSEVVSGSRMMLNISQEARDNLDDLVETGLIRSLRMTSHDGRSVMAYQLSKQGIDRLQLGSLSQEDMDMCDEFMYDPQGELLEVAYDSASKTFKLVSQAGFNIDSTVTDSEDVSYVCSPYMCRTYMKNSIPMSSNAYRASETLRGMSSVVDADVDVQLSLSRVIVLVGDWIPTSCAQIMELTNSLGVEDRNKGGYYSTQVDSASTDTCLEVPVGLTKISICSANPAQFCNMEAEVEYPEAPGITQLESFGLRYSREGDLLCGVKIESVMTKILNDISFDWLSRVIADIQVDSSTLTEGLMTVYQRNILSTVYDGDVKNRQKFCFYMAETITPKLSAHHYLDGDSVEAEIRQLIGDTQHALDVTDNDVIIFGENGVIFAGPECTKHETLLVSYVMLRGREEFSFNIFRKLETITTALQKIEKDLTRVHETPHMLRQCQMRLANMTTDVYRLGEAVRHMELACDTPVIVFGETDEPSEPIYGNINYYALNTKSSKRLHHALDINSLSDSIRVRIHGCVMNLKANEDLLRTLERGAMELTRNRRHSIIDNTKTALEVTREYMEHENVRQTSWLLTWLYAGLFGFRFIDRFVGTWSIPESVSFITKKIRYPLIWNLPIVWIVMSLGMWCTLFAACVFLHILYTNRYGGFIESTATMRHKVCVNTLLRFLKLKREVGQQQVVASGFHGTQVTHITYTDVSTFDSYRARVTLTVDSMHGYLLKTRIRIAKSKTIPGTMFPYELDERLLADLGLNKVLLDGALTAKLRAAQSKVASKILLVRAVGNAATREVTLTALTVADLRAQISAKFCYRVRNLVRVVAVTYIDEKTVDEELIQSDAQVVALRPFQRLNVVFFGKPKPKMAKYVNQTKLRVERQRILEERRQLFAKQMKRISATVDELYPDDDDEAEPGF